jgi:hypothetical protein
MGDCWSWDGIIFSTRDSDIVRCFYKQWRMPPLALADDFVLGFQHGSDAERCLHELRGRFTKFGLELHPDKTRLIEFGRFAAERRGKRGLGKPETFTFLSFTHYCAKRKGVRTLF